MTATRNQQLPQRAGLISTDAQLVRLGGIKTPPGFFGETLRTNPPDLWLRWRAEPILSRDNPPLNQPAEDRLYTFGQLRPGFTRRKRRNGQSADAAGTYVMVAAEVGQWF